MSKRRSLLFIPGNAPSMVQSADLFDADSVIFDLEDAVSMGEKDAARDLVATALLELDFGQVEKIVRINPMDTPMGPLDLRKLAKALPDAILVPKATEAGIRMCDQILTEIESRQYASQKTRMIALIETAYGLAFASRIVSASTRIDAVLLGGEDFTSDMEVERTKAGHEVAYARNKLATLSRALGLHFIDTPFVDVEDTDGLLEDCKVAVSCGATGKAAINPRQVKTIHMAFTPDEKSTKWARRVMDAWHKAAAENKGVFSLDGKMVDAPVVHRAEKILLKAGIE